MLKVGKSTQVAMKNVSTKLLPKREDFFRSLGLTTRLNEEQIGEATINEIEKR